MKEKILILAVLWLMLINTGCGRKGALQDPVPRIPQAVNDLRIVQHGSQLLFRWTPPVSYLNGRPLQVAAVEIMALELKSGESSKNRLEVIFRQNSKSITELNLGQLELGRETATLNLNLARVADKILVFGLRVKGEKGGWSGFSNLVQFRPESVPLPPSELQAQVQEDRILLSWKAPETGLDGKILTKKVVYNLYRDSGQGFELLTGSPLSETFFEDRSFLFGQKYRYSVRAALAEAPGLKESADSEVLELLPVDKFPPSPPAEVTAVAGSEGVALSWLPNQEKDLAGYLVIRSESGSEEILLTRELLTAPVFNDLSVEKNRLYVYSIKAVDKAGNESPPTRIKVRT